jgi:hypothetical protein
MCNCSSSNSAQCVYIKTSHSCGMKTADGARGQRQSNLSVLIRQIVSLCLLRNRNLPPGRLLVER